MTESLGSCGARYGDTRCPGVVLVERTVGDLEEGVCSECGLEYAAPVKPEREAPAGDAVNDPWYRRD